MSAISTRQVRQAFYYVWVALKLLVGIALIPALIPLFYVSEGGFLAVFTFLWPHLDILGPDGELYLRRWFMTPKTKWFHPRFLHLINVSDTGRDPHSHPGPFITRILKNGYREYVYYPKNQTFRDTYGLYATQDAEPGDTLYNGEGHTHMVELRNGPAWTWVVGWIRGRKWGFWSLDPNDASLDFWTESEQYGVKGREIRSWRLK